VAVGLKVAGLVRPEQPLRVTIGVPQLAGRQAHATVSAVDVGILNITRFPVPDAVAHFFAQRRFAIDAYDVYGRVIESHEGGTARIRFGGDMALDALPQARRPTARVQTVDLFSGPVQLDASGNATVELPVPPAVEAVRVETAADMEAAVHDHAGSADVIVMAAAVADFRPAAAAATKLKKRDGVPEIALEPTPDILAGLGARKPAGQVLVGFAAETDDLAANAQHKLDAKQVDLIVANDVSAPDTGFQHDTNAVTLFAKGEPPIALPLADKRTIARGVLDRVVSMLSAKRSA